jgi:hypothetical protein
VSWSATGGASGGLRRVGCGLGGQGGAGQVDQGGRRVGVGADVGQAELAEAALSSVFRRNRLPHDSPSSAAIVGTI